MTHPPLLQAQRQHLANLLEAIQRCVYFLAASDSRLDWPLAGNMLQANKKDTDLFEALAAVNERFAKLQDTLGAAMRHSLLLSGEQADSFLKVLAIFEKLGIVGSTEDWQTARAARNLAAHDYETDYQLAAEHFNTLHELRLNLYDVAAKFVGYCDAQLHVAPANADFAADFRTITTRQAQR